MRADTRYSGGTGAIGRSAFAAVSGDLPATGTPGPLYYDVTVTAFFDGLAPADVNNEFIWDLRVLPVCEDAVGNLAWGTNTNWNGLETLIQYNHEGVFANYKDTYATGARLYCPSGSSYRYTMLGAVVGGVLDLPLEWTPPASLDAADLAYLAPVLAPALAATGAEVCVPLLALPPAPDSSVSPSYLACSQGVSAGVTASELLQMVFATTGWVALATLVRELPAPQTWSADPEPSPSPSPTPTSTPTPTPTPSPSTTVDDYVTEITTTWLTRTTGPSRLNNTPAPAPSEQTLQAAARQCLDLVQAAGASLDSAADACKTKPVLVPGGAAGLGQQAAQHDLDVITQVPEWVTLHYMKGTEKADIVKSQWYSPKFCKVASGSGLQCDEYPMYPTAEGGPDAYARTPEVLRQILAADNLAGGTAYRVMVGTCNVPSVTVSAPESEFVVVPLPEVPVPSFFICGAGQGAS